MILAAGLEGIQEELNPGEPHTENMYTYTLPELDALGIELLPRTLQEAIDAFERDPLMYRTYVDFKRQEWEEYHTHISDWEIQRYLKFF